eukprot:gene10373-19075_t
MVRLVFSKVNILSAKFKRERVFTPGELKTQTVKNEQPPLMDNELGKWGQQRMSSQNFLSDKTERCKEPGVSKPTPEPQSDPKNSAVVEVTCHTSIIQHEIDTGNSKPIKQAPYRVSQNQRDEIESHISKMLEQNIISVSSSPWSSPVVLVKKKDGTTRFCIDYRKLNAVTRKDSFPLPRIDDALDSLAGSIYFTTLDLQSGYHQVAMHPSSKEKTAFISHAGLYEFNDMSFGLTNAPPNFQRLMSRLLHGLEWKICLIYIDDIIMFTKTFEEHLSRLSLVFDRLREASWRRLLPNCAMLRRLLKRLLNARSTG